MSDHGREFIGWVAAVISFLAYPPYIVEFIGEPTKKFWATRWMWKHLKLKGGNRPHQVSWLIWTLLQLVIFISSRQQGASATTWIVLMYLVGSALTAILLFKYGERSWKPLDVVCGVLGGVSLLLLLVVKVPVWTLALAITTDGLAAIPTVVGVTKNPADEPRFGWTIFLVGALINLFAIQTWNFQEAGFTLYLVAVIGYINCQVWLRQASTRPLGRDVPPQFTAE